MEIYIYGDGKGQWFKGISPTGRPQFVDDYLQAAYVTLEDRDYCQGLGLRLFVFEVSLPKPVNCPDAAAPEHVPGRSKEDPFKAWEVHPMDLFGER